MNLADYIRDWLEENDRSQTWLARRAGWSHTYMGQILGPDKRHYPSLAKLFTLAEAMGCSIHTLVDIQLKEYRRKELDPPAPSQPLS